MPLHIDYRPRNLAEVIGNDGIKESLRTAFTREDKPHSVLFIGPSGCGKTTIARIVANMIGCSADDIQEYNSSNTRGIDTIREIAQNSQYSPMNGKVKVYIIDECHKMTNDAQNAMLKLLEDGPKHAYFLLCTTDPDKMIKAIRTRCMTFEVKPLAGPNMTKLIKDTLKDEGKTFSDEVVKLIVKSADGCPRQAMILLDSIIDIKDEEKALVAIADAMASETESIELCRMLVDTRKNRWDDIRFILKGLNTEPESLRYAILGYLNSVHMSDNCKDPQRIASLKDCFLESVMYSGKAGITNACFYASQL